MPIELDFTTADMPDARLGLLCITDWHEVRFRPITRKRLLQHDLPAQQALLRELYQDNLARLERALAAIADADRCRRPR